MAMAASTPTRFRIRLQVRNHNLDKQRAAELKWRGSGRADNLDLMLQSRNGNYRWFKFWRQFPGMAQGLSDRIADGKVLGHEGVKIRIESTQVLQFFRLHKV